MNAPRQTTRDDSLLVITIAAVSAPHAWLQVSVQTVSVFILCLSLMEFDELVFKSN